jgi:hypothetical protein
LACDGLITWIVGTRLSGRENGNARDGRNDHGDKN